LDKSMLKGLLIGGAAAVAIGSVAGYKVFNPQAEFAEVVKVDPVTEDIKVPREECKEELVTHQAPVKDKNRVAGTAIGAVVGGVLGHQVGGGKGKTLATVGGAAAGAYAGNQIQKNAQESDVTTSRETRCKTVYDTQQKVVGYDVAYTLDGKPGTVRMDHDPGKQIPVKDGQLVLEAPVPGQPG